MNGLPSKAQPLPMYAHAHACTRGRRQVAKSTNVGAVAKRCLSRLSCKRSGVPTIAREWNS
eukprot:2951452-Alexandrium_andersonii.AAC.1